MDLQLRETRLKTIRSFEEPEGPMMRGVGEWSYGDSRFALLSSFVDCNNKTRSNGVDLHQNG